MAPPIKDYHADIKYHLVKVGDEPGCYQLHKPKECRLKFPPTKKPVHKCEIPKKETTKSALPGGGIRELIIPKKEKNYYPLVMDRAEFERLQKQAKIPSQEELLKAMYEQEQAIQKAAQESEERKRRLKEKLMKQPGAETSAGTHDPELEGPDQQAHVLSRAEVLMAENMPGPKMASRVILASKCHAIRDAQLIERELIKKELEEEDRRLDAVMEENRLAAEARAEAEDARRHELRLQNLAALKEQIKSHDIAKIMEAERIEEESIRVNQGNIATQVDEAEKLRQKHKQQQKLKEMLDQGNAELLYYKQLQMEEERIIDRRNELFLQKKLEREAKNKAAIEAVKAAKLKGIAHIAKAQKAEQELKEELERIRNLKIQEDVEREYRRKERENAIKRNKEMKQLHEARVNQIHDIHRLIAREIAKDEQNFNNAARQNEEFLRKEKELEEQHKARVERHRQEIMKQINDKERARIELREKLHNQGVACHLETEQQSKYELQVMKEKVAQMRKQKIPEKYVVEVEQTLHKHGYKVT